MPDKDTPERPQPIDILCLIPVRNGSRDLPLCLESVERLSASVIALDDGSVDDTRAILDGCGHVLRVLENPRRETYEGWDDAANRARLLEAATDYAPKWIFWIDADEVLPKSDAPHLRAFLLEQAIPDVAYSLRVHRMIDGMTHYDGRTAVYRIFAFDPAHRLPTERLHFTPVPVSIDPTRYIKTKFRLKHRASLTEADRRKRFAKYEEADPDRAFQESYDNLLRPPRELKPFGKFDASKDVLVDRERFEELRAQAQAAE